MRYEYIKLTNYIGIYNGMGLSELEIDLNKCKYNKIVIKGANGSGKSTLMNAIHIFPDNNNAFVPNVDASKEIILSDNDIKYYIRMIHKIKTNGTRDTTKIYIEKIYPDGYKEELNPNGNVNSYKDIVFSEFMLDSNFIALSKLGVEDRGLVDKTPSERKRFVNAILSNLEVYNNIHKNLSKKSTIFKSMMNSLITKINNISNEEEIRARLTTIEGQLNTLYLNKDKKIEMLSDNKSRISLLDPDGKIQETYRSIYEEINQYTSSINDLRQRITQACADYSIPYQPDNSNILKIYNKLKETKTELDINIKVNENKLNSLLVSKEDEAKAIQSKLGKIASFEFNLDIKDIKQEISNLENEITLIQSTLYSIGIIDLDNISKDEFITGINILKDIKNTIDTFKSNNSYEVMRKSIEYIKSNTYPNIKDLEIAIEVDTMELKNAELELQKYNTLLSVAEKLELKPNDCKFTTCNFIKDAIEADKQNPKENIERYTNMISMLQDRIRLNKMDLELYNEIIPCINNLKNIFRSIKLNISILKKLPINLELLNINNISSIIIGGHRFEEIDKLYSYAQYANYLDTRKILKERLSNLKNDYEKNQSKIEQIEELNKEIDEINEKIDKIIQESTDTLDSITRDRNEMSKIKSHILDLEIILDYYNEINDLDSKRNECSSRFSVIEESMDQIKECNDNISILNGEISSISNSINPLLKERDTLLHNLKLLEEYNAELAVYKAKYEKVDTIKKYSSPTTGIQTLFIEIYMNKTLELSNELLALLFDGKYTIGKLDINENEFKIPCIGRDGMQNDDISSMSTSEKCMISMIISFALLYQSSTKFNILKLDEIDSGLDTLNRRRFLIVLDELLRLLSVEQIFIISHNNELDLENCDIIKLRYDGLDAVNGNIIFSL